MVNSPFGELRVNNVDPITFIAGSQQYFYFDLYNDDDTPFDCSGLSEMILSISPYGNPNAAIVAIQGELTLDYINRIMFSLSEELTEDLGGVYVHQLSITDGAGNIHKPTQGLITIIPKIKSNTIHIEEI